MIISILIVGGLIRDSLGIIGKVLKCSISKFKFEVESG